MREPAEPVPNIVYRIDIRADQHRVWDALTETGVPRPWMWGSTFESSYDGPASASSAVEDTPEIYSGLKSYVETGNAL